MTNLKGFYVENDCSAVWDTKSSRYFLKKGGVTIAQIFRVPLDKNRSWFIYKGSRFDRLYIAIKTALSDYSKNTDFKAWEKTTHIN